MRNLFPLLMLMTASVPAFACGTGAEVAGFLGVLLVLPVAGIFAMQARLTRQAEALLLSRERPFFAKAIALLALALSAGLLALSAFLCGSGLAWVGMPLFALQLVPFTVVLRALWFGQPRFSAP